MQKNELSIALENLAEFYFSQVEPFVTGDVLSAFRVVVHELAERKKIKPDEVIVLDEKPWLLVRNSATFELLIPAFSILARHKFTEKLLDGKRIVHVEPTDLYKSREKSILIEQRIWEVITFALLIRRGVSLAALRIYNENLTYSIGYLHGVHHMDETGQMDTVRAINDLSLAAHTAKIRKSKDAPILREKNEFYAWAAIRLRAGDNPKTAEEVMSLKDFIPKWGVRNAQTFRLMCKEAGFSLKRGRPRKNK